MYNSKIIFHLPLNFDRWKIYDILFYLMDNHKECFESFEIGSLYGSPGSIWNGGREIYYKESIENLEKDKEFIESKNIPLRFTFTNPLIKEEHLQDEYSNSILDLFANGKHQIICNSPILEKYIYDKHGDKYKYISSTTKCLNDKNDIQKEINKNIYSLVVLNVNNTNDLSLLKELNNSNKIEIICNSYCREYCPYCKIHYEYTGARQLAIHEKKTIKLPSIIKCKRYESFLDVKENSPIFVSKDKINDFLKIGINNFKLVGRGINITTVDDLEILSYYLVKDKYQLKILDIMLKMYFEE